MGPPLLAGVVGAPVGHSLSPVIHGTWAERAGLDAYYVPIEAATGAGGFDRAADAARDLGFRGLNVTVPFKEAALAYARRNGRAADTAERVGAANMLTFEADGVVADNSDVYGFQMALDNARASAVGPALVLGAGGAARAVVVALLAAGFGPVRVANRTAARAEALAGDLGAEPVAWDRRTAGLTDAAVLVNATSLGMTGAPALAFDLANAAASLVVCDIVYSPLQTPLLRAAHARGLRVVDGLDMLMRQAEPGFRRWFGAEPRVDAALRARLVAVLEARG